MRARLIGERALDVPSPPFPRQLVRPAGIQLEDIADGHQHIDLVYFAIPEPGGETCAPEGACEPGTGWYALHELEALGANEEIRAWATRAVAAARTWSVTPD